MQQGDDYEEHGRGPRGYLTERAQEPVVIRRGADLAPAAWWHEQAPVEGGAEIDLLSYWRILLKHRLVVIGTVIAALAVGIGATLLMTPIYSASTTLQIDREAAKIVDVEGVTPAEVMTGEEFFQTQYGLLRSVSLAEKVVDTMGLARDGAFIEAMGAEPAKAAGPTASAERREQAVRLVVGNLKVQPVRGSRLVGVAFESPNAQLSARVANGVASAFIESSLERRYESASYARRFLEDRIQQVKSRLEESERQLVSYATSQGIVNVAVQSAGAPGGAEQTASQSLAAADLVAMNTALITAKSERIRAEQRWRQAQGADVNSLPEVLQSPTIQALRQRQATLRADYQDKLSIYKPDFPAMLQLKAQIDELDRQVGAEVQNIRRSIQNVYEVAAKQEASLASQVGGLKSGVMDLRSRSIDYNILQREVDTNRTLYDGLLQRYKEVGIAGGVGTNNVSIVDVAAPPAAPSKPKPLLNIAIAAMAGMVLGALIAFALELLDESIQTPEDVEAKLGLPLLGAIPILPRNITMGEALADPRSAVSEAYYSVRTALQFSTAAGAPEVLLVTSARPSEGKSTSAKAIATNFARLGMKVLLIDCDMRNPSLHRMMGGENSAGLSNVLAGISPLADVVQLSELPTLFFLPCGPLPPNPAELLAGPRLRKLLVEARELYDAVVLDGPPVLGLADAPILAHAASGALLVVEAAGTRRGQAIASLKRLNQASPGKVVGALLTKFNAKQAAYGYGYGYSYAYQYDYGANPQLEKQR